MADAARLPAWLAFRAVRPALLQELVEHRKGPGIPSLLVIIKTKTPRERGFCLVR
jgi:hypothetical protein